MHRRIASIQGRPCPMDRLYRERFLRNIGIMDELGMEKLRTTPIAIGGLGLGGSIFINLVRQGFEDFHLADPDVYERANFNRQRLAKENTIDRRKDDCLLEEARAINPDIRVKLFRAGVKPHNLDAFLEGRRWIVDVVDLFAMDDKLALNEEANRRGLNVVSSASAGFMGLAIVFGPKTPSFAELSGISPDQPYEENFVRFLQFIAPEIPDYMIDQVFKAMNRQTHIPFAVEGVEIAAAMAASEITKEVLGLGRRVLAPEGMFMDPIRMKAGTFEANFRSRSFKRSLLRRVA